jgi:RimJ/RimL family protein N-acetyltransferase
MFVELGTDRYERVRGLYRGMDHSLSIHALIEGNNPGHLFVDDADQPRTALALTVEGYLLAGDDSDPVTNEALHRLFEEQIFSGKVFVGVDSCMVLAVEPDRWEARLPEIIPTHQADKLPRYLYLCTKVKLDWRNRVPEGYSVRRIDRALVEDPDLAFTNAIEEWVPLGQGWGSLDSFLENGVGFCVVHGNDIVARCMADCRGHSRADCRAGERIDVGIITDPAHRRRGLASIAAAATAEYCLSHGFSEVGWHCDYDNPGSWKTAEKVGFERASEYFYYYYIYELADQLSQLGWSCFKRGEYGETAGYYEQVFALRDDHPNYYYNCAAEAWGALGNREMALKYLALAAEKGWAALEHTRHVERLQVLHGTPEWEEILAQIAQNASQNQIGED